MARVAITDDVLGLITSGCEDKFFSEKELEAIDKDTTAKSLSITSLLAMKRYAETLKGKSLSSYFAGQKTVLTFSQSAKVKPEDDPEEIVKKKQRMDKLQRLQQTKEYNQMVFGSPNDPVADNREKELSAFVSYRHQASVGANVVISAAGMGVVFFFLAQTFIKKKQHCLLVGAVGAVGMMILEMILYIIRAMNIETAIKDSKDRDLPSTPPPPQAAKQEENKVVKTSGSNSGQNDGGGTKQKTL